MSTKYRVAPRANRDINDIWEYIARSNPAAADGLVETLHDRFRLLATQPMLGEACPQLRPNLRWFPVGSYVIVYCPLNRGATVEIMRVIHGARDIGRVFERK